MFALMSRDAIAFPQELILRIGESQGNFPGVATICVFLKIFELWSGIRESNPRLHLGKVAYYHYTNPARKEVQDELPFYSMRPWTEQGLRGTREPQPRAASRRAEVCESWRRNPANRPRGCASPSPPGTSSGARQSSRRVHGRYRPGQTSRRRDSTRLLASGGACDAHPCAAE
jgi:hypothetical protein